MNYRVFIQNEKTQLEEKTKDFIFLFNARKYAEKHANNIDYFVEVIRKKDNKIMFTN